MKKLYSVSAVVILFLIIFSSTASASTLNVGSTVKYKTIQSAVDAAKNGDTINVASGTYKEQVHISKNVVLMGVKYPKVDGFSWLEGTGTGTINGFTIQKDGISATGGSGYGIIRNNYFNNCGIFFGGGVSKGGTIMNNQIKGGCIYLYEATGKVITGNTISNTACGLLIGDKDSIPTVSKNTFKNCKTAVYFYGWNKSPGFLKIFSGNKYINNKVNFAWGFNP